MAINIGQKVEFALSQETTYGLDPGSGRQYFDAVSESIVLEAPTISSARLRGGRLPTASALVKGGRKRVTGNLELEVQAQSIGYFLKHLMGGISSVLQTTGVTLHTFYLADLPVGLTVLVKRDSTTFGYEGCRLNTAEFSISDQMLRCTAGVLGEDANTSSTFGSASYPANNDLFAFHEGNLLVDGTTTDVREVTCSFDNQLIEMPKLGSRLNRQPVQGRAVITGRIRKEFEDLTAYNKFVEGTAAKLVLSFVGNTISGTHKRTLDITFEKVFYTGGTPNVASPEPIPQELPFEVRDDGTTGAINPGGIKIELKNDTASY